MIEIFSKNVAFKLKALAVYQFVFGVLGIALAFVDQTIFTSSLLHSLVNLILIVPFVYSLFCGVLLFQKHNAALKHSLINQYLQLVSFSIMGFAYQYLAGIYCMLGIDLTNGYFFNFHMGVSFNWELFIAANSSNIVLNCNLAALALIIFINNLKSRIEKEQDLQVLTIGEEIEKA